MNHVTRMVMALAAALAGACLLHTEASESTAGTAALAICAVPFASAIDERCTTQAYPRRQG